jgi:dCTP deaminase
MEVIGQEGTIGAMLHRSAQLLEQIDECINPPFPQAAKSVAHLLKSFATHLHSELLGLYQQSQKATPSKADLSRARNLERIVQQQYAALRYLRSSDAANTPPSVQRALEELTTQFFPIEGSNPVIVNRPQWSYNLKYVPLTRIVKSWVQWEVVDPDNALDILPDPKEQLTPEERLSQIADAFLDKVWSAYTVSPGDGKARESLPDTRPREVAILSFAGLDREDTLQIPILVHELGHFIDFSHHPPLHLRAEITKARYVSLDDVETALAGFDLTSKQINIFWDTLTQQLSVAVREIMADLLATRMGGLGFFIAQAEFLARLFDWPQRRVLVLEGGYPGTAYRLRHVLDELKEMGITDFLQEQVEESPSLRGLCDYVENWDRTIDDALDGPEPAQTHGTTIDGMKSALEPIASDAIDRALPEIRKIAREMVPIDRAALVTPNLEKRVKALQMDIPPYLPEDDISAFSEIFVSGWMIDRKMVELPAATTTKGLVDFREQLVQHRKLRRLVLKALELSTSEFGAQTAPSVPAAPKAEAPGAPGAPGVLSAKGIARRLGLPREDPRRLVVLPSAAHLVQEASLDLRLGHWFKIAKRAQLLSFDLTTAEGQRLASDLGQERLYLSASEELIIHPGDFVLGSTLEFVALPTDLMAFVEGKSRPGRAGLAIATATQVGPGFHGCIVLELSNMGSVPLVVRPWTSLAQLVLIQLDEPAEPYAGSSNCQIRP